MQERVYRGDTAIIEANLLGEDSAQPLAATSVRYSIKKPDGSIVNNPATINVDETDISIAFNETDLVGQYLSQITFTLEDGTSRSTILSFEVIDPLESTFDSDNPIDKTVDRAWMKLEDLFDSEIGGPHLRDRTMASFNRDKMARLLPDALYNINNFYQPASGYDETTFPYDQHSPLLAQALLVETIYHLIRSYAEQPQPAGAGTPTYFDRRDYVNRWQAILQTEETRLNAWMDLFKRGDMGFGTTSILVGGYASYSNRYPRYMRGRYPYVYRY